MKYAVKIGTTSAFCIDGLALPTDHVEYDGEFTPTLIWGDDVQNLREPTAEEAAVTLAAAQRAAIPTVSPRQIRQALTIVGLRSAVEAFVASSDQDTKDWWEFSTEFERNHAKVVSAIAVIGVSDQQADDLWLLANSL